MSEGKGADQRHRSTPDQRFNPPPADERGERPLGELDAANEVAVLVSRTRVEPGVSSRGVAEPFFGTPCNVDGLRIREPAGFSSALTVRGTRYVARSFHDRDSRRHTTPPQFPPREE